MNRSRRRGLRRLLPDDTVSEKRCRNRYRCIQGYSSIGRRKDNMINISALDNIIAVVVVILLLSLIVQSIQSVLKKALKIKSRQIEDSLIDLFENVVNFNPAPAEPKSVASKLRVWLVKIFGSSP